MNSKRLLPFLFTALLALPAVGQKKFAVSKSRMAFTSNAELEVIKASSAKVQGLLDPSTREFAFTVDVRSFEGFNSALQREHFNEKYMETERYPRARFSGKIIEPVDFTSNGSYDVRAKGQLDIHGQEQIRIIKSRLVVDDGTVTIQAQFFVPLADHNISIPTIVSQKIATEIEVEFDATMIMQPL